VLLAIDEKANTINIIITTDMEKNNGIANIGLFILKVALIALFILSSDIEVLIIVHKIA